MRLPQLIAQLANSFRANPNLVVYIRADKDCRYDQVAQVLDGCQKYGIGALLAAHRPEHLNEPAAKKMSHRHGGFSPAAGADSGFWLGLFHEPSEAG